MCSLVCKKSGRLELVEPLEREGRQALARVAARVDEERGFRFVLPPLDAGLETVVRQVANGERAFLVFPVDGPETETILVVERFQAHHAAPLGRDHVGDIERLAAVFLLRGPSSG